jgi:hypothetical protein
MQTQTILAYALSAGNEEMEAVEQHHHILDLQTPRISYGMRQTTQAALLLYSFNLVPASAACGRVPWQNSHQNLVLSLHTGEKRGIAPPEKISGKKSCSVNQVSWRKS